MTVIPGKLSQGDDEKVWSLKRGSVIHSEDLSGSFPGKSTQGDSGEMRWLKRGSVIHSEDLSDSNFKEIESGWLWKEVITKEKLSHSLRRFE